MHRPARFHPAPAHPAHAVLGRLLWQWLAVGVLLWCLFPPLRGATPWLGQGALWLLALPASALLVHYRGRWPTLGRSVRPRPD